VGSEEINLKFSKEFLLTAKEDLKAAEVLLKENNFNNSVYHSQQACEKAIKALLILHNEFLETHFVADRAAKFLDEKTVNYAKSLERNWIITRYPFKRKNEIWSPVKAFTKMDAEESLEKAKFVVERIEEIINKHLMKE